MIGYPLPSYGDLSSGVGQVLFTAQEIEQRVRELGAQISADYADRQPILVGVLKGVLLFMADLSRAIDVHVEVDFMAVAGYSPDAHPSGRVRLVKDLQADINGRHVIFVEDMVDTGLTLSYLLRNLRVREPASLEVCALFSKDKRRLIDIPIKYKGFDLPDRFVVGYGLDYREQYRNLPCVGLLKPDIFQAGGS